MINKEICFLFREKLLLRHAQKDPHNANVLLLLLPSIKNVSGKKILLFQVDFPNLQENCKFVLLSEVSGDWLGFWLIFFCTPLYLPSLTTRDVKPYNTLIRKTRYWMKKKKLREWALFLASGELPEVWEISVSVNLR